MRASGSQERGFFRELKRRKVYHVAVAYVVVAFAVWEAADIAFPYLGLPTSAVKVVLVFTVLGFPLALVLAWAYELRPQDAVDRDDPAVGSGAAAAVASAAVPVPAGSSTAEARPSSNAGETAAAPRPRSERASIAVLAFADMSGQADDAYFAAGVAEELINALAQVRGLRVVARTSSFGFRDSTADIREIGRMLGVRYLVEGSVRRASGRLRVTAQLIDADDGYHLWSERYERPVGNVFDIQDEIVEAVTESLLDRLRDPMEERSVSWAGDVTAYETYLKARSASLELTPEGLERARELYEEAIERDPQLALAHVGLAQTLTLMATGFGTEPPGVIMARAGEAADRALDLSPHLPEGHLVQGILLLFHEWDFPAAREELERAIELSPSSFDAWFWLEFYHTYVDGDYDAALHAQRRARQLNPLDPTPRLRLAWVHHIFGHREEAETIFHELYNEGQIPHMGALGLAEVCAAGGRMDEALRWGRECLAAPHLPNNVLGMIGGLLAIAGHRKDAEAARRELAARSARGAAVDFWLAAVLTGLGRADQAFEHLERAFEERDPTLLYLSVLPPALGLTDDPRYRSILERMGLGHLAENPQRERG